MPSRTARLRCEALEDRLNLAAATGVPYDNPALLNFKPVAPSAPLFAGYSGPVATTTGDVTGDGLPDTLAAAGSGGHVKAFDGTTGAEVASFLAYPGYSGPVQMITRGTGTGTFDIVTAAGQGGHVKVFDGKTGAVEQSFLAYPGYDGPIAIDAGPSVVRGAAGQPDPRPGPLVTVAGRDGHVKVFDGTTAEPRDSYLAFPGYDGPVAVAAPAIYSAPYRGDVFVGGGGDVVVAAGVNGHVKAFDGRTGALRLSVQAFPGSAEPVELQASWSAVTVREADGTARSFDPDSGMPIGAAGPAVTS